MILHLIIGWMNKFDDSLDLSLVAQMSFNTNLPIKTSYNYNDILL
jgi:hypothetical protein